MIEAGVARLAGYSEENDSPEAVVIEIFEAMMRAAQKK